MNTNHARQLTWRSIAELIPYANNARTHSPSQVAQIAASIKEFGWTNPILIDEDGMVVAGHGRLLAARSLGLKEAPTIELAGLSKSQIRAYVLADNKLAENAGWDRELLALELGALKDEGFALELVGFSDLELDGLFDAEDLIAGDDSALLKDNWAIIIECESESEQSKLLDRFEQEGLKCRALI